jgi:hypothetical protein
LYRHPPRLRTIPTNVRGIIVALVVVLAAVIRCIFVDIVVVDGVFTIKLLQQQQCGNNNNI